MDNVEQLADPTYPDETCLPPATNHVEPLTDTALKGADEILNYRHVPLQQAGTRSVRYGRVEPLRPRSFQYDEDHA